MVIFGINEKSTCVPNIFPVEIVEKLFGTGDTHTSLRAPDQYCYWQCYSENEIKVCSIAGSISYLYVFGIGRV